MATMNFSIPEDVKDKFNEVFKDDNKSAVITELMRKAIEEKGLFERRKAAIALVARNYARTLPASRKTRFAQCGRT